MKKLALPLAWLAIIIAVGSFSYPLKSSELVYVDINKLLDGYKKTKLVRTAFEERKKTLTANLDSLLSGWQNELELDEKEQAKMTKKELQLKQEMLGDEQQQIDNYQKAIQRKIQEEENKASETVINDINTYVKEYGKKEGYKIIFGFNGSGNIMYANETIDLTLKILEGLNKEFDAK